MADLQGFDIGLMPLVDDPWSWGKCGLKIIQYQGVGVPVVCTPVGINQDLVEDGANGFYAMTPEEWEEKLSLLIENAQLREQMGREGRKRVLENYTFQACAPRLFSILNRVVRWRKKEFIMLFNSFSFLIFFPTVTVLYFLIPHRYRWFFLLVASCIFYMAFIPIYILVLALTIAIDYTAALLIERAEGKKRKMVFNCQHCLNLWCSFRLQIF